MSASKTPRYVRVRPGQGQGQNLVAGRTYQVFNEDSQFIYLSDDKGGGWNKLRFEDVPAENVSLNSLEKTFYKVMSESGISVDEIFIQILRVYNLPQDRYTVDHMHRINKHFQEVLSEYGLKLSSFDVHNWTIVNSSNGKTLVTDNPVAVSLSQGNVITKAKLVKEIQNFLAKESDMAMSDRKKTAMEAVRLMPNSNSYAFGGFVRDHLANEEFKDLDIYVQGSYGKNDYLKHLKNAGFNVVHLRKGGGYMGEGMAHNVYSIAKDGHEIMLDLIEDPDGYGVPVKSNKWDADVNQVYMRKDGSINVGFGCKSNLETIKQKILNKEYTPLPGLTPGRREKLAAKGYYQTGAVRPQAQINTEGSLKMDTKATPATAPAAAIKPSFMDKLKVNAEDAAYRVAATQMTSGTKAAILAIMEKQGQGSERIKAISEMLDTEVGSALVAGLLGLGLQYAPMVSEDPRAQRLADEFQVAGMATVGNAVVGIAMEHFVPVVMGALSSLPQPTKQLRVTTPEQDAARLAAPNVASAIELEDNSATPQPAARAANAARNNV